MRAAMLLVFSATLHFLGRSALANEEDPGERWKIEVSYEPGAPNQCRREQHDRLGPKSLHLPYQRTLIVRYDRVQNLVFDINLLSPDELYIPNELRLAGEGKQSTAVELLALGVPVPFMSKIDLEVDGQFQAKQLNIRMRMPMYYRVTYVNPVTGARSRPVWRRCTLQYRIRNV